MNFSVIIPCYNCLKTLETTVNSIRTSDLRNYELLLIDDGSTDGTGALCDVLCEKYPELRCIHQPNAGVSAARNRGVDEARGDYLWFVDSGCFQTIYAVISLKDFINSKGFPVNGGNHTGTCKFFIIYNQ